MKKFKVTAKFTTYCTVEILAEDENDAYLKAKEMDGGDFEPWQHGDWEIDKVQEVAPMLTREQVAFIDAYCDGVGDYPAEVVEAWFLIDDGDEFNERYGAGNSAYTSIADAHNMWRSALAYARENK